MSANLATYEEVVQTMQCWPAAQRYSLAQFLFQSLEPELKRGRSRKKNTLSRALGLLETAAPAPTDEQVRDWINERGIEKYG